MKRIAMWVKVIAAVSFLVFAGSSISEAQGASRTWVSGVGDDANPCSRTAPCKTFAGAISKTAAGGIIDVLDPGGFGAVTIVKAITIDGSGGSIAGVLVSGTNAIVVAAGPNDVVTLRNLDIEGISNALNGIRFTSGGTLNVEKCQIYGFGGLGIDFEPSAASRLVVSDTTSRNNTAGGVLVSPAGGGSAQATLNRVQAFGGAYGIRGDNSIVDVHESVASNNANNGFLAHSAGVVTSMMIDNSEASNNNGSPASAGVHADGANATVRIGANTIFNNSVGLAVSAGGLIISFGNNNVGGNTSDGVPSSTIATR